ncbi:Uncharacterised protein [Bordetella pertussis]|nr:Uncharacterised protein [Bordetella pertussis]
MASIRLRYFSELAAMCERPMEWLDFKPRACSMWLTNVPKRSRKTPFDWRTSARISGLTRVLKTIGGTPASSALRLMRATTSRALSSVSMKGRRTGLKLTSSNCDSTEWLKVSAGGAVLSETM